MILRFSNGSGIGSLYAGGSLLFYVLLHLPELPESVPYGKAVRREHHTILCKFPDCVQTAVPFLSDAHSHLGYPPEM